MCEEQIGNCRFNYDLQRHEMLMADGWVPTVPEELCADTWPGMMRGAPIEAAPDDNEIHRLALQQLKQSSSDLEMMRRQRDNAIQAAARKQLEIIALMEGQKSKTDREQALAVEVTELRQQLWLPTEPGSHPYYGPTKTDPETGDRVAIHDLFHERFYAAVGDVLAGRINRDARKQMQEALKVAPKEPIEVRLVDADDRRRMGTWGG